MPELNVVKPDHEKDALWSFIIALCAEANEYSDVGIEKINSMLIDHGLARAIDDEPWIILNCDLGGPDDYTEDR